MTKPRICLVSSSHPCSNPRLIKEADALHEAGFSVHAVLTRYLPALDGLDREVFAHAGWTHSVVDITRPLTRLRHKFLQTFARRRLAGAVSPSAGLAALAHAPLGRDLAHTASQVPADLYLGHVLAALPAVVAVAERRRVKAGFDAEDFHTEELPATPENAIELKARRVLEQALLPRCAHLTAASPLIAEAYRTRYGLTAVPVLNVFPRRLAPAAGTKPVAPDQRPTLYWFSQTIGPERGLEALIDLLAHLRTVCDVHLRGLPAPGFPEALRRRAQAAGWRGRLEFYPLAPPDEMARLAAGHTLGLSLEQTTPRNRDLCLTNKIFTYLLAGVPVLLTPTQAQSRLAAELGAAAMCLDFTEPAAATRLDDFLASDAARAAAAAQAGLLGRTRYNWDIEKEIFLHTIRTTLNLPHP
jgi:glycosyltransferase involved in cell wall biosynthesis